MYSPRDLQLDVNLLTSEFPATLADALDRVLTMPQVLVPVRAGRYTRFWPLIFNFNSDFNFQAIGQDGEAIPHYQPFFGSCFPSVLS